MNLQLSNQIFQQSTEQYRKGNYQICLALLNDCIVLEPNLSILYSNRALSNFALKDIDNSIQDLQKSIKISHLHYIGYMNLFSLNFLKKNQPIAHKYLCLGLSSTYTILHTLNKQQKWVDRSLHYSYNNKESLFLKAMYLFQEASYLKSLQYLKKSIQYESSSQILGKLYHMKQCFELKVRQQGNQIVENELQVKNKEYRLQTSMEYNKQSYFCEVQRMINEFNTANNLINSLRYDILNKSLRESKNQLETNYNTQQSKFKKYDSQYILNAEQNDTPLHNQKEKNQKQQEEFIAQSTNKSQKLNIQSVLHSNHQQNSSNMQYSFEIQDQTVIQKIQSYSIYKQGEENNKLFNLFIEKLSLYTYQDQQINQNLFLILDYQSAKGKIQIKTSKSRNIQGLCRWDQWSDIIQSSNEPQILHYVLYERISQQQNIMLGNGKFQLLNYGFVNLPIFSLQNEHIGDLQLIINKVQ